MATVHAVGMPENESERKAISYLRDHLPENYLVFHNLELSNNAGLPYEYDLIVVGEYAVYVVEVKGYQGLIRGNATEWEMSSGYVNKSPIPLNNKKCKIVHDRLIRHSYRLENVWVESLIVLTDDNVRLQIKDDQSKRVLKLADAVEYILNKDRLPIKATSIEKLFPVIKEAIFGQFQPLRRQQIIGDYKVIETISKNNLYTTLLAEHSLIRTKGRFFLKVYSFDIYTSDEARKKRQEWILRDANALMQLGNHLNIVQSHIPFPWDNNKIVLPLEWVDGYSLRGLIDSGESLDLNEKIKIILQITNALHHAHTHGVIHRDLKPDNIIITKDKVVKLVNFDFARIENEDMQTIATRIGRDLDQRYVAPEVWENVSTTSVRSDIYALGILFYELITGQLPYQKIKELKQMKNIIPAPSSVKNDISYDIDEIIKKMCAFEPSVRYENVDQLNEDIQIII